MTCFDVRVPRTLDCPTVNLNCAKVRRMNTMHARPRRTDRHADGQTDKHHGNSATIRSNERIAPKRSILIWFGTQKEQLRKRTADGEMVRKLMSSSTDIALTDIMSGRFVYPQRGNGQSILRVDPKLVDARVGRLHFVPGEDNLGFRTCVIDVIDPTYWGRVWDGQVTAKDNGFSSHSGHVPLFHVRRAPSTPMNRWRHQNARCNTEGHYVIS